LFTVTHSTRRPQPFSSRHNGYLSRYATTGVPHILDTRRSVIGLTKQRTMFPANLTVVKISGLGQVRVRCAMALAGLNSQPATEQDCADAWCPA
jgi:hypothetical protein